MNSPLVYSFVLWGFSSCFGFLCSLCHHCYSLDKTGQGKTLSLRPTSKIDPIRDFFQPKHHVPPTIKHVWFLKIIAYYTENEPLLPPFPRSLLWMCACDGKLTDDHWRAMGPRSNFSLPRVVEAIYVQSLPHPQARPQSGNMACGQSEKSIEIKRKYARENMNTTQ